MLLKLNPHLTKWIAIFLNIAIFVCLVVFSFIFLATKMNNSSLRLFLEGIGSSFC